MNTIGSVGWICGVCGASNHPDNKLCALSCHQAIQKQVELDKFNPGLKYQPEGPQSAHLGANKYQVPVGGLNEYGKQNDFS